MRPVHLSKDDKVPVTSNTTTLVSIEVDFTAYTNLKQIEGSDLDDTDSVPTYRAYKNHTIMRFRNAIARAIIANDIAMKACDGKLGQKVSLLFM